jgi:hypothetical protein
MEAARAKKNALEIPEYQAALEMFRHFSNIRRHDLAFITTAQGAVLAIIAKDILNMGLAFFLLSLIAAFLLVTGLNNERRLTAYMRGYMKRAKEIEHNSGMTLLSHGHAEVTRSRCLLSNAVTFPLYYAVFLLTWLLIWIVNVVQ